jgi:prepilin-type N-terminal cleavage/methylation domain-containing protein
MNHSIPNPQSPIPNPQHGFTLIELLVVIAILSVVSGLLVAIVYQFLIIPRWGNAQLAIDHDLGNAGLWLMRDGNESQTFITTTCTFDTGRGTTYHYALVAAGLERTDSSTGQTVEVAHYVSGLTCTTTGAWAVVALDVAKSDVSASQTFTITMRAH